MTPLEMQRRLLSKEDQIELSQEDKTGLLLGHLRRFTKDFGEKDQFVQEMRVLYEKALRGEVEL